MDINDKTTVPLFVVIGALPVMFFVVFSWASVNGRQDKADLKMDVIEQRQDRFVEAYKETRRLVQETHDDVVAIKEFLKIEKGRR